MNLHLQRDAGGSSAAGILSTLMGEEGHVADTLEHAYADGNGGWVPKIPNGIYTCVRGRHRLHGMDHDFETFEITGVEGHKNLLFHWGNFNRDSEGCVLLGDGELIPLSANAGEEMITGSRGAFEKFMQLQAGCDRFLLTVEG